MTNRNPITVAFARAIDEGAQFVESTKPGEPGLDHRKDLAPGTIEFGERPNGQPVLIYVCPCGCGVVGQIPLAPIRTMGQTGWEWEVADDMRVAPTLSPSIRKNFGCRWHGHLKKGVWTPCDDWLAANP